MPKVIAPPQENAKATQLRCSSAVSGSTQTQVGCLSLPGILFGLGCELCNVGVWGVGSIFSWRMKKPGNLKEGGSRFAMSTPKIAP